MIKSFQSRDTERLHNREGSERFKAIKCVALRKLRQLDAREGSKTGRLLRATGWKRFVATGRASTAFGLTVNGASVLYGGEGTLTRLKLLITIRG
jgi:plasmid maintenance system killer protein